MEEEWSTVMFEVMPYKETGTYILKSPDEASQLLDDHIVMTQSMTFSPYKKPFEERISKWESTLRMTQVSPKMFAFFFRSFCMLNVVLLKFYLPESHVICFNKIFIP